MGKKANWMSLWVREIMGRKENRISSPFYRISLNLFLAARLGGNYGVREISE
jgi:hypothetical protein